METTIHDSSQSPSPENFSYPFVAFVVKKEMDKLPFPALKRQVCCRYEASSEVPLLDFLAKRFHYLTREAWAEQIQTGNLCINQHPAQADQMLQPGALLEFIPRELPEPPVSWDIQIIFEDEQVLILNKPGNLPCHPSGTFFNHTLWAWLKQYQKLPEVHFCNRLDRETSGLVIVGKSSEAAQRLNRVLQQPDACKEYLVLVQGKFPDSLHCNGWLLPDANSPVRKKRAFVENLTIEIPQAESACTEYTRLAYHPLTNFSLLKAILKNGRTHQIRATLCSLGFPVIGDKLYGVDDRLFLKLASDSLSPEDHARLLLPRQALHAWKITFRLPAQSNPVQFTAPLPQDMRNLLEQLNIQIPI